LIDVGDHFGLHASTIRTYLLKPATEIRERRGGKR
jgi:hypothetical protein